MSNDSHTAFICERLELFGGAPADAIAAYPAPDAETVQGLMERMTETFMELVKDTCLELDAQDLLWNLVNVFHRKSQKLEREIDATMLKQRDLAALQDGSEIASHNLEQVTDELYSLQERLRGVEMMREAGAEQFEEHTGSAWVQQAGSRSNRAVMTAAMLDAREVDRARQRHKAETLMPEGTKIIVTGGASTDHNRIYAYLDKLKASFDAKGESLVILHGAAGKGVDKIVATWAKNRNVPQVLYVQDWKLGKQAPFKRNDKMLTEMPAKTIVINPDSGIYEALIRESKKLGIPTIVKK
jgi:YspA, cpYpsA-related SLOG family